MQAIAEGRLANTEVVRLVCDRPSAPVLAKAAAWGVPQLLLEPKVFEGKNAFERTILTDLANAHVDCVALAGYMRIVGKTLLDAFEGRMVNIHPSLLPAFPGRNAISDALAYGVKVTGVSVHFVDEGVDTGPIIAQEAVAVLQGDDYDTLARRIHAVEHRLYPQVLKWLAGGLVSVHGRHVRVAAP